MKKISIRLLVALLLASFALPFVGCGLTQSEEDATVPWNRPADYEGTPGMPNMPQYRE